MKRKAEERARKAEEKAKSEEEKAKKAQERALQRAKKAAEKATASLKEKQLPQGESGLELKTTHVQQQSLTLVHHPLPRASQNLRHLD